MGTPNIPAQGDPQLAPNNSPSLVLENLRQIKAGQGVMQGLIVTSTNAAAQFVHVYDSVAAPTNGAVPVLCLAVPATGTVMVNLSIYGLAFFNGLWIGNSTTAASRTAGAADSLFYPRFE